MDSGKNGQNHVHHVIEHLLINKSRGDYFFEKFSFFGDLIWDMLLVILRVRVLSFQISMRIQDASLSIDGQTSSHVLINSNFFDPKKLLSQWMLIQGRMFC